MSYIRRKDAKNAIMAYIGEQTVSKYATSELCKAARDGAEGAFNEIEYIPSADVQEVRHGSWIVTDADDGMCESYEGFIEFHCSECGSYSSMENGEYDWYYGDPIPWKYCPMCGAKTDGERREG